MAIDFKAAAAKAVTENNVDMTKAKAGGGGDYAPPKEGPCLLRLVGYVEIGKHAGTYQGKPTNKEYVQLVVELCGPNHPPIELEDGTKMPQRVTIEETLSMSENSRFFPLAQRLLYKGDAQHVVACLGDGYKGRVVHRKYAKRGEDRNDATKWTGIAVELYDKKTKQWTIEPPRREIIDEETDMPTGEYKAIVVPPALSELRGFLWNYGDEAVHKAMWDSLFIEGEYPERKDKDGKVTAPAKSKNVLQNTIKSATNFKGSPIHTLLLQAGVPLDIPEAEVPGDEDMGDDNPATGASTGSPKVEPTVVPEGAAADDALNGIA